MKWQTKLEIVDITTGELLQKSAIDRKEYIIVKKTTPKYTIENYLDGLYHGIYKQRGTKSITWEVIPNPQIKLL